MEAIHDAIVCELTANMYMLSTSRPLYQYSGCARLGLRVCVCVMASEGAAIGPQQVKSPMLSTSVDHARPAATQPATSNIEETMASQTECLTLAQLLLVFCHRIE